MLVHGHESTSLLRATVILFLKSLGWTVIHEAITELKHGAVYLANFTDKLNRQISIFQTSNLQFGFKEQRNYYL